MDDTRPAPSPVRTRVCALVVTGPGEAGLRAVLDAIAAQSVTPDRVLLLDRTDPATPTSTPDSLSTLAAHHLGEAVVVEVRRDDSPTLRSAVHAVAASLEEPGWLLWVLPAGAVPESTTLAELLGAHRRSPSSGIVAPKLVDAADPTRLRSVGISATRAGRIVDEPADGAPDQGQYDQRHDVLAVPLVGALIEADLLRSLRGWEPTFGEVAGDLDLGWRAQRRGRRVLVVPRTRMRVPHGIGLATAVTGGQRRAGRRVALARAGWWGAPLLALWLVVGSLLSALALLLVKRPRAAWSALGDLLAVDPVRGLLARWRTRGPATVRRSDLAGLFVSGADVRRRLADQVFEALLPGRAHPEGTPPEHQRSTAARFLLHPGLLATLVVAAVYGLAGRTLGLGFLTGLGGGPVGGELIGGRISAQALWHAWADPWRGAGLGSDTLVGGPHLALLAVPTWLVEHLPGLGGLASPGGAVIGLFLLAAPLLATLSAYAAARVLTDRRWLRAVAAVAWALAGPAGVVYAEGRLGAAVAHVILPAVGAGLVLLARDDGTATAAWATALAAGVLAAFAPATLLVVAALAFLVLVGAPTAAAKARALVPLVVPTLLLGPWLLAVADEPRRLLAGPGLTQWGGPQVPAWQLGLLRTSPLDATTSWAAGPWLLAPVALIAGLGLLGLLRGGRLQSLGTGLAVTAVLALAAILVAPRLVLATSPATATDAGVPVTPWVGLPMLLLLLVLLAAATWWLGGAASRPVRPALERARAAGIGFLGLAAAGAAALLVVTTLGTALQVWSDPRPAVAIEHAEGDVAGRAVFVVPGAREAGFRVMARELTDVARALPVDRSDDGVLSDGLSALLEGTPDAAATLARYGIGVVAVAESADSVLTRTLDAADGLTRLVARDGWNYWRVAAPGPEDARPVAPSRLELRTEAGGQVVPTSGQHGATSVTVTVPEGARLEVAEPLAWTEHARVTWQGTVVPADVSGDRPAYALRVGEGTLDVELTDPWRAWRLAQLLLAGAVVFLAVPFGSKASRRRS